MKPLRGDPRQHQELRLTLCPGTNPEKGPQGVDLNQFNRTRAQLPSRPSGGAAVVRHCRCGVAWAPQRRLSFGAVWASTGRLSRIAREQRVPGRTEEWKSRHNNNDLDWTNESMLSRTSLKNRERSVPRDERDCWRIVEELASSMSHGVTLRKFRLLEVGFQGYNRCPLRGCNCGILLRSVAHPVLSCHIHPS